MAHIKVEQTYDCNECETCGGGSDYGGTIWVDGKIVWQKPAFGSCYDGEYMGTEDYLRIALENLGHTLEFE